MAMIEMSIASHHLSVDAFDIAFKGLWEAAGLSKPLPACRACKLRNRSVTCGRTSSDWNFRSWRIETPREIRGWVLSTQRGKCCVSREDVGIIDLAHDPLLDQLNVLNCRNFDWFFVIIEPSVCVTKEQIR